MACAQAYRRSELLCACSLGTNQRVTHYYEYSIKAALDCISEFLSISLTVSAQSLPAASGPRWHRITPWKQHAVHLLIMHVDGSMGGRPEVKGHMP